MLCSWSAGLGCLQITHHPAAAYSTWSMPRRYYKFRCRHQQALLHCSCQQPLLARASRQVLLVTRYAGSSMPCSAKWQHLGWVHDACRRHQMVRGLLAWTKRRPLPGADTRRPEHWVQQAPVCTAVRACLGLVHDILSAGSCRHLGAQQLQTPSQGCEGGLVRHLPLQRPVQLGQLCRCTCRQPWLASLTASQVHDTFALKACILTLGATL